MELCACGGYPVAICTQCQCPLCNHHAYKRYAYPSTDEYKRLETFLSKFPNPNVRGEKFDVASLVSSHLINSYEDRHICLSCHQQNVQRDASALLNGLVIPEEKVDFILWLLFDTPFHKLISLNSHNYTPYLSDKEMIRFWLRFARRANVPLATSSPVWEVGGLYTIDLAGKVYDQGAEVVVTSEKSTYYLHERIGDTVYSLLAAMPETAFPMSERKDDETFGEYTAELLRQWQAQYAIQQQHYQTLTASLRQTAMNIAEAMKRIGMRQDAAVGGLFSKTVGWFVWIDSHEVNTEPGEYFNMTSKAADALIISNGGTLYTATGTTSRLRTDPRTIINRSKNLTEVKVTSEQEFRDVQQKLANFAEKHKLQV